MVLESVISQTLIPTADGHGRAAAFEVMHASPAIKNLIREGKTFQIGSMIQTSKKIGMQTMDDAIYDLYNMGRITAQSALEYAQDRSSFEKKISNFM